MCYNSCVSCSQNGPSCEWQTNTYLLFLETVANFFSNEFIPGPYSVFQEWGHCFSRTGEASRVYAFAALGLYLYFTDPFSRPRVSFADGRSLPLGGRGIPNSSRHSFRENPCSDSGCYTTCRGREPASGTPCLCFVYSFFRRGSDFCRQGQWHSVYVLGRVADEFCKLSAARECQKISAVWCLAMTG